MKTNKVKKEKEEEIELTPDRNDGHINWYPGHMNKAIRKIKEKLKMVDILLEVRDARSPLVTGNSTLTSQIDGKCRLIIVNKTNLADPIIIKQWESWYKTKTEDIIFINCFDKASIKEIIAKAKSIVLKMKRLSNPDYEVTEKLKMMIIGLPNTGKSTIINMLANRKATKAADKPGLTQSQLWVKIDENLSILDTPGVMPPKIKTYEHGLWLSSLHAIPDTVVSTEVPACFIVNYMLEKKSEAFKSKYKFDHLDMDLVEALDHIATVRGCIRRKGQFDYDRVYKLILIDFRSGELGRVSFGLPPNY